MQKSKPSRPGRRPTRPLADAPAGRDSALEVHVKSIRSPVDRALVLVCRECGAASKPVRKAIRRAARRIGGDRAVRVAFVKCLDVCPKGRVTVAVVPVEGPPRFAVVDGPDDAGAVLASLDPR